MPLHPENPTPKTNPCESCDVFKKGNFNKDFKCSICYKNPKRKPFSKIIIDNPPTSSVG